MKAFFITSIFVLSVLAVSKKDEASSPREIIAIAQNLILQKDREQAIRILSKAQLVEKNKAVHSEIRSVLKDIGSLFLYDKAQQEFESSISFRKTDPANWLDAIERAQKIEPDNTLIMLEVIRNYINKKDIKKAKEHLEEFRRKNAFDQNVVLAGIFIGLGQGDLKEYSNAKSKLKELKIENGAIAASYIDFLDKVNSGNREKTILALAVLKKEDSLNPQIAYWENRLSGKAKSNNEALCPSFPERFYRRYFYDLFFCSPSLDHFFKIEL